MLDQDDKVRAMLLSLGLTPEALERNRDLLEEDFSDSYNLPSLTDSSYRERLEELRSEACESFSIDADGFSRCQPP